MSALLDTKEDSYAQQRNASAGAGITLVYKCGEFHASMICAKRCAEVLGSSALEELGDGLFEVIPRYRISLEDISTALAKLSARYSVALIDLVCDKRSSRFVLIWKILPTGASSTPAPEKQLSVDDL